MEIEFKSFEKIQHIGKLFMTITQKIHGTNGQIYIEKLDSPDFGDTYIIRAASRTRWLTVEDDNAGFCKWVGENEQELIEKLGPGRHYGEWTGKGINRGEGLEEKHFVLFDHRRFPPQRPLPDRCLVVPVLYKGTITHDAIDSCMHKLKTEGSKLVPGYMFPEGVVVELADERYKCVFTNEETKWKVDPEAKAKLDALVQGVDVSYLLQPIRLEKLLSSDERLTRDYPITLKEIASLYVRDLISEGQIEGSEEEKKIICKAIGRVVFPFIKSVVANLPN